MHREKQQYGPGAREPAMPPADVYEAEQGHKKGPGIVLSKTQEDKAGFMQTRLSLMYFDKGFQNASNFTRKLCHF